MTLAAVLIIGVGYGPRLDAFRRDECSHIEDNSVYAADDPSRRPRLRQIIFWETLEHGDELIRDWTLRDNVILAERRGQHVYYYIRRGDDTYEIRATGHNRTTSTVDIEIERRETVRGQCERRRIFR